MKALLFEANPFHYEVLPGFAKCILDCGWEVGILEHENIGYGNEFCLFPYKIEINYHHGEDKFKVLKKLVNENQYDALLISSLEYHENGLSVNIINSIEKLKIHVPYFVCCHWLETIRFDNQRCLLKQGKILTLSNYQIDGINTTMVNPNYFGNINRNRKKNSTCKIIRVGTSTDRNNMEHAIDDLDLKQGELNFSIIGSVDIKALRKSRLRRRLAYPICKALNIEPYGSEAYRPIKRKTLKMITNLGRLTFERMYEEIQNSDFILLDIDTHIDNSFCTTKTSGSKQISLGFNVPCIITQNLAEAYGFDDTNAIVFSSGELKKAVKRAINMTNDEYENMCINLNTLKNRIEKTSVSNMAHILNHIMEK